MAKFNELQRFFQDFWRQNILKVPSILKRDAKKFRALAFAVIPLSLIIVSLLLNYPAALGSLPVNAIVRENRHPGTTQWQSNTLRASVAHLGGWRVEGNEGKKNKGGKTAANILPNTEIRGAATTWSDVELRGYADQTSVNIGQSITFYVSDSSTITVPPTYDMQVYRMGWYGGTGATLKQTISGLAGQNQPDPSPDPTTGLIEAKWQPSYTLTIPSDGSWTSGVYLAKLIEKDGSVGYIIFVVRNDAQQSDILFQIPVNTYEAYNNWGGKSLYDYNSSGSLNSLGTPRAYKVSFDRPYADGTGTSNFFNGDYNMIRFLEKNGLNVTYATSIDTQTNPSLLNNNKVFLTDYHDEYWSTPMRNNITAALSLIHI